jgi:iron complex transport system substrate-binding protein
MTIEKVQTGAAVACWKKRIALLSVFVCLGFFAPWKEGETSGPSPPQSDKPKAGSSVPKRIISMGPNITETVFALGRGDCLVGVTDFCIYPAEARALPRVGGFFNPNLEKMTALRPDLVVLQGRHEKVDGFCRAKQIAALHVAMDSIATIYGGVAALGDALGASREALELCNTIRFELEAVRKAVKRFPRRKVFISLGRAMGSMANLYTVGGPSFLSEVVDIAGGDNIFFDVNQPYPEASKESLLKRAPEVILEMRPGERLSEAQQGRIVAEWNVFGDIPAVVHQRIYVVVEDFVLVPGPRIGKAARVLAQTLHGDIRDGS